MNPKCGQSHLTITSPRKNNSVEKKSNEANQIALHTTKKLPVQNGVKIYKMIRMPKYRRWSITLAHHTHVQNVKYQWWIPETMSIRARSKACGSLQPNFLPSLSALCDKQVSCKNRTKYMHISFWLFKAQNILENVLAESNSAV